MTQDEAGTPQPFVAAFVRYQHDLRNIPPSGGGGCHLALLRIANLGRLACVNPEQIAWDLAVHIHGSRRVTEREIRDAIDKAFNSQFTVTQRKYKRQAIPRPAVNGTKLLDGIVKRGAAFDEAALWESSPVRIDWPPERDSIEILRRLYLPEDRLFLGTRFDAGVENILPASEWMLRVERGVTLPPHIIPNPLTGKSGYTKDGGKSYRADSCVACFRYAVVEFDAIPRERQIRFWGGVKLPVVALTDSGGKSVHGWIWINASNTDDWTRRVEEKLFSLLTAIGADGACKNEGRLSRMPGHFRGEKKRWQRLLYLNPAGGPIVP